MTNCITSLEDLETLYGAPSDRALFKEIDHISDHYRAFIEAAPFAVVASVGAKGIDASPRGDAPGFVTIIDPKTLHLPDRRGNNRLDTLRNLVVDPRISLLFMIPGVGETLRIKGTAILLTDSTLCGRYAINGKAPKCIIEIKIDRIYYQCQKALARSRLWEPDARVDRSTLPSAGDMLQALSDEGFDGKSYDKGYPDYMKKTIY